MEILPPQGTFKVMCLYFNFFLPYLKNSKNADFKKLITS